jgi:hypothetical protein
MFDGFGLGFKTAFNRFFNWTVSPDPAVVTKNNSDSNVNKNLILKFFDINHNKKEIIRELDKIKDFYFTQLIIDRCIEDALNPTNEQTDLFKVKVKNSVGEIDEAATKLIEDFVSEFNVQRLIVDIAGDLLTYGEHYLRLDINTYIEETSKKGIINIHDDVDFTNIIPVFRDSDIGYYITIKNKSIETIQPSNYVYFSLPSNRIKVQLDSLDDKILYFRMGKPLIYPAFGLLKELKLLESMLPIGFINTALKTPIVSVGVPSTTKPTDAIEITKTYERMLNKSLKIDINGQTSEQIIKTLSEKMGQVKVIPDFGDKGNIELKELGTKSDFEDMSDKILDLRKMILTTIGLPSSIIDEESIKTDIIKDHIRYGKKLKSIQDALREGLKRMFIIHLVNNGFDNFIKEDIEIKFLNVLNTDDIEKLEYIDLMVSMLNNFKSFMDDFDELEDVEVNKKEYYKFLNHQFNSILGFNFLKYKDKED